MSHEEYAKDVENFVKKLKKYYLEMCNKFLSFILTLKINKINLNLCNKLPE